MSNLLPGRSVLSLQVFIVGLLLITIGTKSLAGDVIKFTPAPTTDKEFDDALCAAVMMQTNAPSAPFMQIGNIVSHKGRPVLLTPGPGNQRNSDTNQDYWFWYPISDRGLEPREEGPFNKDTFTELSAETTIAVRMTNVTPITPQYVDPRSFTAGQNDNSLYEYSGQAIIVFDVRPTPELRFDKRSGQFLGLSYEILYLAIEPSGTISTKPQSLSLTTYEIQTQLLHIRNAQFLIQFTQ